MTQSYIGNKGYTIFKSNYSVKELQQIRDELTVKPHSSHNTYVKSFPIYRESDKKLYIPRYYGLNKYKDVTVENKLSKGIDINLKFKGLLYEYQHNIINKYIKHVTKHGTGGGLLDVEPGKGKTVMALNIISIIKKKTLVVVHKEFLMDQWKERIQFFLPDAKVGKIQGEVYDIEDKDIVLCMLQTVSTKTYSSQMWSQFGLTVYDECHRLGAEVFSNVMVNNTCNHNLGLSGTMTRKDGLSKVFKWFLGPVIHKEASDKSVNVNVKVIEYTNDELFKDIPVDFMGRILYSSLISKLCECKERTNILINIIQNELKLNYNQQIMVLGHNRNLLEDIFDGVSKFEKSVGYYLGGMKRKDLALSENKKVIIATYSMASEGLDIKTLTTLLMATPKSDVCQSVGRILRSKHDNPIVIDVVDNFHILKKQYVKRLNYYNKKRFKILNFKNFEKYIKEESTIKNTNNKINNNYSNDNDYNDDNDILTKPGICLL